MLVTRLVVRLLGAEEELLGWNELMAEARGDGQLWATESIVISIEREGRPSVLSVHWVDVNVEVRTPLASGLSSVPAGSTFAPAWPGAILRVGDVPKYLAPVIVNKPVVIGIPPARLGTKGN